MRKKSLKALKDKVRARTTRSRGDSLERIIEDLNPMLKGWFGYFQHATPGVFAYARRLRPTAAARHPAQAGEAARRRTMPSRPSALAKRLLRERRAVHPARSLRPRETAPDEETSNWRAVCGRTARTVVCPAKAGMFSRRQTCRGKSQEPRSLDSRVAGNQNSEAYRQRLPRGDDESPGRNESKRECGLESA